MLLVENSSSGLTCWVPGVLKVEYHITHQAVRMQCKGNKFHVSSWVPAPTCLIIYMNIPKSILAESWFTSIFKKVLGHPWYLWQDKENAYRAHRILGSSWDNYWAFLASPLLCAAMFQKHLGLKLSCGVKCQVLTQQVSEPSQFLPADPRTAVISPVTRQLIGVFFFLCSIWWNGRS
jgi:hypothetical protein